mmetsp:Transcript_116454/g.301811  ORF Transcript_116454/g.301811 Transcript_116454/m.301811 type:complete len:570 (+) Transcript_116454:36-1745(+)
MESEPPSKKPRASAEGRTGEVVLLDYGAGNVQSVINAVASLGFTVRTAQSPADILAADRLIFPGVGSFGSCVAMLKEKGYFEPLKRYLTDDRPFFGICLGMQTLFEGSEESEGVAGLGILPGIVTRFPRSLGLAVPHIAWTGVSPMLRDPWPLETPSPRCYFVHSYRVPMPAGGHAPWALACSEYGERYVCAVRKGNCVATQFHPEKSGQAGLDLLQRWLQGRPVGLKGVAAEAPQPDMVTPLPPARRIIACLDVRSNDAGDLVVTKGDQYDVREGGQVRNHGKPVALASRYYEEGADEVTFLNITAFRDLVLADQPMLNVLHDAAKTVFVPLTVGGGIRSYVDKDGKKYSSLEVADAYFRAGADKVSIGSDSVEAAVAYYAGGCKLSGTTSIECISKKYGRQAVVISVDPRRVYVRDPAETKHACVEVGRPGGTPVGPSGERFAWYCCTLKGGRENSDVDVVQLVKAMEALGAGEVLLNCIDRDGQGNGYELELIQQVKAACSLPVIASSGAGRPDHFEEALSPMDKERGGGGGADAALAAGIFHRQEVPICDVKAHLAEKTSIPVRR